MEMENDLLNDLLKDDISLKLIDMVEQMEEGDKPITRKLIATEIVELEKLKRSGKIKFATFGGITYISFGVGVGFFMCGNMVLGSIFTTAAGITLPPMFYHAAKLEENCYKLSHLKQKASKYKASSNNQIEEEAPEI